ncbi:MAG: mercury transporter [Clostridia bacterium]|nr:mercury transporter [Clostridia bacterium]
MDVIDVLIKVLRVGIIPTGVILRVIYCFIKMMYSEDEVGVYKKRIVSIIIFGIVAELIFVIKDIIILYFS